MEFRLAPVIWSLIFCMAVATANAAERFNAEIDCYEGERGDYPFDYEQIVDEYIRTKFFDPASVMDLRIYKPIPSWWWTGGWKPTRKNSTCLWAIFFEANGRNRMGGYVGIQYTGLYTRGSTIQYLESYNSIEPSVVRKGEKAFADELAKLPVEERQTIEAEKVETASFEAGSSTFDYIQELKELAALKEQGIISEAEFESEKSEILTRNRETSPQD